MTKGSEKMKNLKIDKKAIRGKSIVAIGIFVFLLLAPLFMSEFRTNLLGKYMCFALIAIGIDMIWGYTGILSLGHGVYFGLGAYCMAMHLKLEASGSALPDFMTWSGITKLPGFWVPFQNGLVTLLLVILVPATLAIIIGYLTFLNRIKGVYFSILSQALAASMATLLIGMQQYLGGSNGLTNFSTIFGKVINKPSTKIMLYYITAACLILAYVLCDFIVKKRVGKVLVAIRDAENRARFTGYNPATYKVFVYCLSAILAGVAGALYVTQVGIITPYDVNISPSIEMVIWTAVGGRGTLIGPVIGALVTNTCKSLISESFPEVWSYFIGVMFIVVILFLPNGLVSLKDLPSKIKNKIAKKQESSKNSDDKKMLNKTPISDKKQVME